MFLIEQKYPFPAFKIPLWITGGTRRRIWSRRVVADPARWQRYRFMVRFAVVKQECIGFRYQYRRYRLVDRHANHRHDDKGLATCVCPTIEKEEYK